MKLFFSKVHICLYFCCVVCVLRRAQEKLLCEQIQQSNLVAVRCVLSLDCILEHLLLTSLGIFTPLGSKEGLCMKYLLKKTQV